MENVKTFFSYIRIGFSMFECSEVLRIFKHSNIIHGPIKNTSDISSTYMFSNVKIYQLVKDNCFDEIIMTSFIGKRHKLWKEDSFTYK